MHPPPHPDLYMMITVRPSVCVCLTLSISMLTLRERLPRAQGFHPYLLFYGHLSTEEKAPASSCRHQVPPDHGTSRPAGRSGAPVPFGIVLKLPAQALPRVPTAARQRRDNRLLWGQNLI